MDAARADAERRTRRLALGLMAAISLHNLEEGLTFPYFPEAIAAVARWALIPVELPDWDQMRLALVAATLVPVGLIGWVLRRPARPLKAGVIVMLAAIMLANALVPHLALTLSTASYSPGAVTALALNIPLCGAILIDQFGAGLLSRRQWALAIMAGIAALPVVLVGILWLSGALLR